MANRKLVVEIVGDSRSLEKAFRNAGNAGSSFGRTMSGLAKGAGFAGAALGAGLASQVVVGLRSLSRIERIAAQTNAVIESTGGVANVTGGQVSRLSDRLEKLTSIEAEQVQEGANLLLTFRRVRNEVGKGNKIFDRATKAAVDLSVAGFGSIETTAKQLGKALEDPVRGMTALRRAGVTFTKDQENLIRTLVETGDVLGAQKMILKEVETQVGRSGKALGDTLEGRMRIIGHLVDEVREAFAKGFLPVIERVAAVLREKLADPRFVKRVEELGKTISGGILKVIEAVGRWFERNWGTIQDGFQSAARFAGQLAAAGGRVYGVLRQIASVTPGGTQTLIGILASGILLAKITAASAAVATLQKRLLLLRAPILIPIMLVLMNRDAIDNWVKNKLGPLYGGGRATARTREEFERLPDWAKRDIARQGKAPRATQDFRAPDRRGRGGPVAAFGTYLVGERGPELLQMGSRGGNVIPGGAGGVTIQNLILPGVTNPRQFLAELQRIAGQHASQQRGRYGGQVLSLS